MLVHMKRDEMLKLASQVAKAVPRKTTVEELKGIHIEADARYSMLTLTATNFEIAMRTSMPAAVEQPGSAVMEAGVLLAVLAHLPEDNVDMEMSALNRISVRSGEAEYCLNILPGEKYPMPELPFPEDTVPVSGLRSLVRNTVFAVSENTETPLLHCVRLSIGPDGLKASGTNSFCIIEAEGDKNCKGQTQILLPAHTLKVLSAVSSDSDVYEMGLAGKSVVFWNGTLLFSARLMEGNYPDTTRMLDGFRADYTVNLDAEELANAISMTAPVGESEKRIELSFGEHELYLRSLTEHGRAMTPVKALVLNAPNTPFYYNYEKLLAYLRLLKGNVTLEFDRRGLLVIRPGETRYMQSPMRPPKGSAQAAQAA